MLKKRKKTLKKEIRNSFNVLFQFVIGHLIVAFGSKKRLNVIIMNYPTRIVEIDGIAITVHFDDLQTELVDEVDYHDKSYIATGFDANGRTYKAIAVYSCDELIDITDIEQD